MHEVFLNCHSKKKKKKAFCIYKKGVMFTVLESVYSYKTKHEGPSLEFGLRSHPFKAVTEISMPNNKLNGFQANSHWSQLGNSG